MLYMEPGLFLPFTLVHALPPPIMVVLHLDPPQSIGAYSLIIGKKLKLVEMRRVMALKVALELPLL